METTRPKPLANGALDPIAAALAGHPDLLDWAAFAGGDEIDGALLVAVVPDAFCNVVELRELVREHLGAQGETEVAVALVDTIDREQAPDGAPGLPRLPAATLQLSRYVPPDTDREGAVAGVWREILGVDRVGLDDEFLDLGGDSMAAVEICARLEDDLGCTIALEDFFRLGTVRLVSSALEDQG